MPAQNEDIPHGIYYRLSLETIVDKIAANDLAWSPDGKFLAAVDSFCFRLWNTRTGKLILKLEQFPIEKVIWSPDGQILLTTSFHLFIFWDTKTWKLTKMSTPYLMGLIDNYRIDAVAWSPDGQILALGTNKGIQLVDVKSGKLFQTITAHSHFVLSLAWSLDGLFLASGSKDKTVQIWNREINQLTLRLEGHSNSISSLAWSPDGEILASGSVDTTIWLWDLKTGQPTRVLEGHTNNITALSFSSDGQLLVSASEDETIRFWRSDTWNTVVTLNKFSSRRQNVLALNPKSPALAIPNNKTIDILDLEVATLLGTPSSTSSVQYTNAKVVLVGDTGVGKSGLALVLTAQPFAATESTHARHVWTFDNEEVETNSGLRTREILLWDLAGQSGYRLIHQLHLKEVAVALVVFDPHSESNPLAGVNHWVRALAQVQYSNPGRRIKKFLVAARMDRGGKSISHERIKSFVEELGFDGYFETSAKDGRNIVALSETIRKSIDWDALPKVSSTDIFQRIKSFLMAEKEAGRLLSTREDLFRAFLISEKAKSQVLYEQFETCLALMESRDLIRRLSFGNFILLQPELLDAYASSLVNAVKDEPDSFGSISEEKVQAGDFSFCEDDRIKDREQEKLLLIAMIEDLLRHEIALREVANDGSYLVFPSQSTRENPDLLTPEDTAVIFSFEGPILNVYTTLAVRLSHSGLFKKKEIWKNAVTYITKSGGTCGMLLRNSGEGSGELALFYDATTSEEMRFHFEEFIQSHLQRRALPQTLRRHRIFTCLDCKEPFTNSQVIRRQERGFNWLDCPVCGKRNSLLDLEERLKTTTSSFIQEMDISADIQRDREAAKSVIQGKMETKDFDVFLCHNKEDKPAVKKIGEKLKEQGILPWLDEWELQPGLPWQHALEQQIGKIKAAAVFVGKKDRGPWQNMELYAFLNQFVTRGCPVIPVILPDCKNLPDTPIFLQNMTWVDFSQHDPDPMKRLIWGITGKRDPI